MIFLLLSYCTKKYTKNLLPEFSLNDFYKIYDDYTDFKKSLDNYINTEDDDENKDKYLDESVLNGFSAIFDLGKITLPLHYAVFYGLQEMFWKTVVVGGIFADMNLSAYLMNLSLDNSGEYKEEGNNLIIDDEYVTKILFENSEFKKKINELLIGESINIKDFHVDFIEGDLFLALHGVDMNVIGSKNDDESWNLEIAIRDRYDFTDIIMGKKYINSTNSILKSLFSSTLNNFAAISSEYGVIKPFYFIIKAKNKNYAIE